MRRIDQSTADNLTVLMVQSSDHITGLTGATLTITASKAGGAYASITPTVTELSSGNYSLALTTTHTNTLGDLALHITAASGDPVDVYSQVKNEMLRNKLVFNKADGSAKMYDSANNLLFSGFAYMDAAMTKLYDGTGPIEATSFLT